MRIRRLFLMAVLAVIVAPASPAAEPATKPVAPQALAAAAKRAYETMDARCQVASYSPERVELLAAWSLRWASAESDAASDQAARAAAEAHVSRMRDLHARLKARTEIDVTQVEMAAAEYHVAEAEAWAAKAATTRPARGD